MHFRVHHCLKYGAKARHRVRPCVTKGCTHTGALGVRKSSFQCAAIFCQKQVAFPFVRFANATFDKPVFYQCAQDPVERLFGDTKDVEQIVDRRARRAADEVDRPVMRATIGHVRQNAIRVGGEAPIRKKHCLDPLPQLFVGEKEKVLATSDGGCSSVVHARPR